MRVSAWADRQGGCGATRLEPPYPCFHGEPPLAPHLMRRKQSRFYGGEHGEIAASPVGLLALTALMRCLN